MRRGVTSLVIAMVLLASLWAVSSAAPVSDSVSATCQDLSDVAGLHKQSIYDPTTDTLTIVAFKDDGNVVTKELKLKASDAKGCPNQATAAYISSIKRSYAEVQEARCKGFAKALAAQTKANEDVPFKDLKAAQEYHEKMCAADSK